MSVYIKCEGAVTVSTTDPSAYQCSTGFVQVDEPVYTLVSREQASALIGSLMMFAIIVAVFRSLPNVAK